MKKERRMPQLLAVGVLLVLSAGFIRDHHYTIVPDIVRNSIECVGFGFAIAGYIQARKERKLRCRAIDDNNSTI